MKVLVTAASKHGATAEIARRIGEVLSSAGIETDVRPPEQVTTVAPYDVVILGSGVYTQAVATGGEVAVERESDGTSLPARLALLEPRPVGDPAKPDRNRRTSALIRKRTHAIDHRVFQRQARPARTRIRGKASSPSST